MPARYSATNGREKPWQAKVQLAGKIYWLGVYRTREEAETAELTFKLGLQQITDEAHAMWRYSRYWYTRVKHLERALEYFSHTFISPPDHQKDLAVRALAGERIWEL